MFIPILVVVFAVVLFFPRPDDGTQPAAVQSESAPQPAQQSAGWAEDGTTLPRQQDGHFYADVTVANVSYHMLVDTGASVVALTGADAQAMGLRWSDSEVRVIGQGASGDVRGVPTVIGAMQLGQHEAAQVPAVIIPEGLPISLLGQSFLSGIGKVEIAGDNMMLGG